ncbi:type III polyketide synthase [Alphaproteobacteria bacterium]|nr:type III polyketide synthase [Alphaproteobacteria bacterium]
MAQDAVLLSLSNASPQYVLRQEDVLPAATKHFSSKNPSFKRLMKVYMNAAINKRYSCMPLEWYGQEHTFSERNKLYLSEGVKLIEKAAKRALEKANMKPEDIDGIIAVSSSGIATPSLDALLIDKMDLKRNIMRLPIFGLGCVGGVLGLARAASFAKAHPGKNFLLIVLELCGLTFRHNDFSKSNIVATALFSDGASAAIISTNGEGPRITAFGEYTWQNSLDIMGWEVKNDGLAVVFSRDIPNLVKKDFFPALKSFLNANSINLSDINSFVCHPGGIKVIEAIEETLKLPEGSLRHSREVLMNYGNMSAVTVMFVLEKALQEQSQLHLMTSLGPGFTAGFLTLDSNI